jgi:hypothetical protein
MARMKTCVRAALGGVLIGAVALASAAMPTDTNGRAVPLGERSNAALLAAGSGADYDQGYRDGYGNQAYRDKTRSNRAYADGFKAGQEQRRSAGAAPAGNADYQSGWRDGYDRKPYNDKNRSNKSYAEGFKAGQTDRERSAAAPQRPGLAAAAGRPRSLVGHNADDLENEMKAIGYTWRSGTMKGRDSHTTWRGATDSQCVLAVSRNGKVASVSDVAPSSCR